MNLGTSLRMHVNAVLSIFHVSIFKTIKNDSYIYRELNFQEK